MAGTLHLQIREDDWGRLKRQTCMLCTSTPSPWSPALECACPALRSIPVSVRLVKPRAPLRQAISYGCILNSRTGEKRTPRAALSSHGRVLKPSAARYEFSQDLIGILLIVASMYQLYCICALSLPNWLFYLSQLLDNLATTGASGLVVSSNNHSVLQVRVFSNSLLQIIQLI
jgi:hypothetical protein